MADGAFAGGSNLRHDAPVAKCRVSTDRFGSLGGTIHSLVTEKMPTGSGRRPCPYRWGFVADSTPESGCDIGGVLFVVIKSFTLEGCTL